MQNKILPSIFRFNIILVLAIALLELTGCTKSLDGFDMTVTVSDQYQQQDIKIVDVAIHNGSENGNTNCVFIYFITNKALPGDAVFTVYDKNDRVLRKHDVGSFAVYYYDRQNYKLDPPSFQYTKEISGLDARLIHKVIIGGS